MYPHVNEIVQTLPGSRVPILSCIYYTSVREDTMVNDGYSYKVLLFVLPPNVLLHGI